MARGRSPNYPHLTLEEAIQKGRLVYTAEHFHTSSREVVAKDMGYQSLNGASLTAIAALRHYNILADENDGLRISGNAVDMFESPKTDKGWQTAVCQCAFAPVLFKEMYLEFGEGLPSEANLRHWLIKKSFMPKAADSIVRVYRENMEFAKDAIRDYDVRGYLTGKGVDNAMQSTSISKQGPVVHPPANRVVNPEAVKREYSWPLSKEVTAEVRLTGKHVTPAHLEMLRQYLDLAKAALEADDAAESQ